MIIEYKGKVYDSDSGEIDLELLNSYKKHPEPLVGKTLNNLYIRIRENIRSKEDLKNCRDSYNKMYSSIEYNVWYDGLSNYDKYVEFGNRKMINAILNNYKLVYND